MDLSLYAGRFSVTETFVQDSGTSCGTPPTTVIENRVDIRIQQNEFQGAFQDRWGTMVGEIYEEGLHFIAVETQQGQRFEFSGGFADLDHWSGDMRSVREGCTRTFALEGERFP